MSRFFPTIMNIVFIIITLVLLLQEIITIRFLAILYLLYCLYCQFDSKVSLFYKKTIFNQLLISRSPILNSQKFAPLFFFPHPFLQCLLALFSFSKDSLISKSMRVPISEIILDWISFEKNNFATIKSKLLIILPGLTGSINDGYIKEICVEALNNDFDVVVYNTRWLCSIVKLPEQGPIKPLEDLKTTIDFLQKEYPFYKLFAVGTSHGANLLTKYQGVYSCSTQIKAAVSIGNYFNLYESEKKCGGFWNYCLTIILKMALKKQKQNFLTENLPNFFKHINVEQALKVSVLQTKQFDELFTRRILGYETVDDYYRDYSSSDCVKSINKPILCLQSYDDPICHYSEIPVHLANNNENLIFFFSKKGGHCGWVSGFFKPVNVFPKITLEFLQQFN